MSPLMALPCQPSPTPTLTDPCVQNQSWAQVVAQASRGPSGGVINPRRETMLPDVRFVPPMPALLPAFAPARNAT